jgi:hypothetical protein
MGVTNSQLVLDMWLAGFTPGEAHAHCRRRGLRLDKHKIEVAFIALHEAQLVTDYWEAMR